MSDKILCIGGPLDGTRQRYTGHEFYFHIGDVKVKYESIILASKSKKHQIYINENIVDPIECLINNYRK